MIKKIFNFVSFLVVSSLVLSMPLAVLAQDAGTMPPPSGTSGGFQQPMQQPSSGGSFGGFQQPMTGTQSTQQNFQQPTINNTQQFQQPMMGTQSTQQQPMTGDQGMFGSGSGSTCKVNGVEMPGGCDKWNQGSTGGQSNFGGEGQMGGQNNQFGNQGQNGQGGEGMMGQGGQGGPSDEQMQKMDEQRQAQEKKMQAQGLKQMKKGMTQFARGLKQVSTKIAALEKKGITVPAELKDQVAQASTAVETILKAEDFDAAQEQMDAVQEMGNSMPEVMQKLETLSRLPQMIKKAKSEIKRLEKSYASAVKKVAKSKIDASSILTKWQTEIETLKATLAKVESGAYGEDDPMQIIGEEIFENMQSVWRYDQVINTVLNIKRNLKQVATSLKKYETTIARFEKKGEDMSEARTLLGEMKAAYDTVNNLAIDQIDPEEMDSFLGDLDGYMEMQQQMEEMLNMGGPSMFEQQMKQGPAKEDKMPQLQTPNFDQMMKANEGAKNEFVQQWSVTEEKLLAQFNAEKVKKLQALASLLKAAQTEVAALQKNGVDVPSDLLTALGFSTASSVAVK